MGATSTSAGGGNFENPEAGACAARCYGVVEIGTHEGEWKGKKTENKKVIIFWELDQRMEDERPFSVNEWYTNSLSEKANLRKALKSWRGKDFTEAELQKFELGKLLNQPCMLNLTQKEEGGKVYVGGVMPLPKGMTAPPLENPTLDWGIDDLGNNELWDKLYPWVQNKIMESYEYKAWASGGDADENQDDDSAPPF